MDVVILVVHLFCSSLNLRWRQYPRLRLRIFLNVIKARHSHLMHPISRLLVASPEASYVSPPPHKLAQSDKD